MFEDFHFEISYLVLLINGSCLPSHFISFRLNI